MHSKFYKTLFLTFLIIALSVPAVYAWTVSGKVVDTEGEPLTGASVRLLSARDSSQLGASIADADGKYSIAKVKNGRFIVEVSFVGSETKYKPVTVQGKDINLGTITVGENATMLRETVVKGVRTPMKVMEDTVEFSAESYKTQPNAVVEDLLKRLPGVEVDTDGKITANGKEVTKILIDGKEFFSDDPKVASKNLPVNMVEKLQVVDRKSDLARMTGVDDGEEETVINLTVKKGMQNGWFGTVEAGYGTDERYQATANVNRFWDGNQITFIGSANNTNELGFTDGNGNRFRRFGGDRGINNSQSFGVNFNVGNGEILRVGGDVMYSHTNRNTFRRQNREYLLGEDSYTALSVSDAIDKGNNVRGDFRLQWKPNDYHSLDIRPNFSINYNDSYNDERSLTSGKNLQLALSQSNGKSYEAGMRVIYNYNFKSHPGRSFSTFVNYSMSNVRENADTYSYIKYLLKTADTDDADNLDEDQSYSQYTRTHTWSNSVRGRVSWTEPIGDSKNGHFLTFAYTGSYRWNNSDKSVYQRDFDWTPSTDSSTGLIADAPLWLFKDYTLADTIGVGDQWSEFRNRYFNQDIRAGYKHVNKTTTLELGASLVPQMQRSDELTGHKQSIPERWVWNYAPFLRYRYKMGKTRSINLNYRGRSSQPSMTQLQPVIDTSDPMNITVGNPDLKPYFTHSARVRFQDFNTDAQRSIMAMADFEFQQNSIVSKTSTDLATGARRTEYTNVNGVWGGRIMNMISMPLSKKNAITFNNNFFTNFNQRVGFTQVAKQAEPLRNTSRTLMVAESFSVAWRPQSYEVELRPMYRLQKTFNTVKTSSTNTLVHNYGGIFNGTAYLPLNFIVSTDLTYSATSGYASGYNTNQWMWNASLSYQFLKGKSATIQVKAYDLLQQKKSINRSITANYIDDTFYNSLTRYFMCTFTYKFNTFGKGNQPTDRNERRWGPPGGGPGGRPH